jgi:YegS/Rv2252/BmrU family lipid kinase
VNPQARRARHARLRALREFARSGVLCEALATEAPGHATQLAHDRAGNYDAVFTLGGDGTAMEVITALAPGGPPVGVLPGGTGNLLGRSLGIPIRVTSAVSVLLHGREARIDLGRLTDGRHFAIGLGVGIDEAMIAGASPRMKKRVGVLAYFLSALKAGLRMDRFAVRLTVDGQTHACQASSVLIMNLGSVLGGWLHFGEPILHDDGLLHAFVFSPDNTWDALRIFARMLRGRVANDPKAFYMAGREFRLETDPPRRVQADGELLDVTPVEISVQPRAGRVLVPA